MRAQTLAVEARPFIERARALGATDTQLMTRQVLPNVMPLILVSSTLTVASAILSETTLTFLGLGDPTVGVVGRACSTTAFMQGAVTAGAWWYLLPPGIAILIVVLGLHPGRPRRRARPQRPGAAAMTTTTRLPLPRLPTDAGRHRCSRCAT